MIRLIAAILIFNVVLVHPAVCAREDAATNRFPTIAMITWRGETEAERGFVEGLVHYRKTLTVMRYHADQDLARLERIIADIKTKNVDLIYVFGTLATQTILKHVTDTPVVYNIVTQPVAAGIIQSWAHSGNNAVGASNQVPMESQLKALKQVVPFKRLGIIYNPKEPNSRIQRDMAFQLQSDLGFVLMDFKIASAAQMPAVMSRLKGAVDAVFIPADSLMISLGEELAARINDLGLPSLATVSTMVRKHGLLLGLLPSYYRLGISAAEKAERILQGEPPSDISSSHLDFYQIIVNLKTARNIGVQIPMSILVIADQIVRD